MNLIDTKEKVNTLINFINQNDILSYDVESTGLNTRKDKIIGFGVANATEGYYVPLYQYDLSIKELIRIGVSDSEIMTILTALAAKKLLAFNMSFDGRMTKFNFGIDLVPSLYCDVLLLKHTCDENYPLDLKGIAAKIYGVDVKKEKEEMQASIKQNGGNATDYYKASLETLSKYCIQDASLTYRLYDYYSKELQRQGLEDFFYNSEVMPLYKQVTIPMEERGVRIDMPLLNQKLVDIDQELVNTEVRIQTAIAPDLALFTTWFLNKDYPLQTNTGKMPAYIKKHGSQLAAFKADNPNAYMFNLQSKHHLKKLFFDTLGCEPLSRTPTGLPQVDEDFIESVSDKYAWCKDLVVYNKLSKIKSTYYERFLEESENGQYYASFKQHSTVSGRYGSDFQQLPRTLATQGEDDVVSRYSNIVRELVIAPEGYVVVSADYEQLEPTIFAHTSGDKGLQSVFNDGLDFYSFVGIATEGLQGVSADKSAHNYLGKVNKAKRQAVKAYALGIAYGETGYKLQFELGIPQDEAEQLVAKYWRAFPALHDSVNKTHDQAVFQGWVKSEAGRSRRVHEVKRLHSQYGSQLKNSLDLWKKFNSNPVVYAQAKQDRKTYINLLNSSVNFKIQSLAASIVNQAAIKIAQKLKSECCDAWLIAQVHDELVMYVRKEQYTQVAAIVKTEMENVRKLSVALKVEPQFGNNYAQCK